MCKKSEVRILETIPTGETCDMTMMENPTSTHRASSFGAKHIYPINPTAPLVLDECSWNPKCQVIDPPNSRQVDDIVPLSYSYANGSAHEDSKSPSLAAPNTMEGCNRSLTNETVLECDTPELMVCYKDINYHAMKDICIDEGMPLSEDEVERPESKLQLERHSEVNADVDSTNKMEKDFVTTDQTSSDGSIEDSFINRALPIQEYGTRSFLRSFIISLDDEESKAAQSLDQMSSGKLAESDLKEDVQASSSFSYNCKVESKIITFNFEPRGPEKSKTKKPSIDSRDKFDHKNSDTHNLLYSSHVHCQQDACSEKVPDESLKEDMMDKNVNYQLLPDSANGDDIRCVSLYVPNFNDDLMKRGREKHLHGETSFSDAGFITHSGPIPFSGSISFRSDNSAASGKSFAFPILQSEWNSSPVRTTKSDQRHFRKHKFWRSRLLCCRF